MRRGAKVLDNRLAFAVERALKSFKADIATTKGRD